jgi:transposase-like protein
MPRTRRSFSTQFKAQTVIDLLTGVRTQAEVCRQHKLSPQLVARWKAIALEQLHCLFDEESQPSPEQTRIAELERLVGRQTLELEILKKASRMLPGPSSRNGRSS